MVAEGHDDGEGDLFEFIRSLVGDDIPLISTLDLHANVTDKMARHATALIPYEKYPHIDTYETGYKAASIMADTADMPPPLPRAPAQMRLPRHRKLPQIKLLKNKIAERNDPNEGEISRRGLGLPSLCSTS